jgi:hypothetical protein
MHDAQFSKFTESFGSFAVKHDERYFFHGYDHFAASPPATRSRFFLEIFGEHSGNC